MATAPLTCAYCNALVNLPPGTVAGTRVECPRCGEAFRLAADVTAAVAWEATGTPSGPVAHRARPSNRLVAGLILFVMATMALIAASFAFRTEQFRRNNDRAITKRFKRTPLRQGVPDPPLVRITDPARLTALGYFPPNCNVVAAVNVAEAIRSPEGKKLLEEKLKIGDGELAPAALVEQAGIDRGDVDYLLLGLPAQEPLSALVMLSTTKPCDVRKVAEALRAEHVAGSGSKARYRFTPSGMAFPLVFRPMDKRTILFCLSERVLEAVPDSPNDDILPAELRGILRERVEPGAAAWIAGHVENPERSLLPILLARLKPEDREPLMRLRTFAVWLRLENGVSGRAALRGRDDATVTSVATFLKKAAGDAKVVLRTAQEGDWLSLQWQREASAK